MHAFLAKKRFAVTSHFSPHSPLPFSWIYVGSDKFRYMETSLASHM